MSKLQTLLENGSKAKAEIQFIAIKRIEADMKRRVFNDGKATDGSSLGKYKSRSHIKKRTERGRQTGYKDLDFEGDLRRSLTTGEQGQKAVLGFTTNRQRLIAEGQEKQTGKSIWEPSKSEIDAAGETVVAEIKIRLSAK